MPTKTFTRLKDIKMMNNEAFHWFMTLLIFRNVPTLVYRLFLWVVVDLTLLSMDALSMSIIF